MSVFNDLKNLLHSRFQLFLFFIISFTLFPILSSSHFSIISEAWSATYYVDAKNGNNSNNGLSMSGAWKTIAKIKASVFNPGDQILFKGGRIGGGNLSFLLQDKKADRLSVSLFHLSRLDIFSILSIKSHSPTLLRMDPNDQPQNTNVGSAAFVKNKDLMDDPLTDQA